MTNEFDELEELKALERRIADAELRRRQLIERQQQLENEYNSYETPERLKEISKLAENTVSSANFREQFCRFYTRRGTKTTTDIVEGVVGILLGANIPLALASLIVIKLLRTRLDDYCEGLDETDKS